LNCRESLAHTAENAPAFVKKNLLNPVKFAENLPAFAIKEQK
jgi:hypothetical protein